ncbi:uncharacterized protein LOC119671164 [Teleopsis dalmanni]|nr:uncharacterized protein LOC119671164 [Teleopsis dalmanni]
MDGSEINEASLIPKVRTKRGIFWDFFQKVITTKNLVVDQFIDTKNSLNEVYNMFNSAFSDPAPMKPTLRPPPTTESSKSESDEENTTEMSTTTERYTISRYEFGRILGRNFRGLQRLMKIELDDAFNQTQYNIAEYKAEAKKQFANSLPVEAKNKIINLKG